MVAHAHIQLVIVLLKKICSSAWYGKLCSEFDADRSISDDTILSTDAGRTDVYVILNSVQCYAIDRNKDLYNDETGSQM